MALQNALGLLPPFVSSDTNNTLTFLSLAQTGGTDMSLPFSFTGSFPALRSVQRSYCQFIIPANQPAGWFKGIAFKGVQIASVTSSTTSTQPGTFTFAYFTGPQLRAAIMDTDNSAWLDNVNNTSLPRNILATMSTGTTWAQAALNTIPVFTGPTYSQLFGFYFDKPVYLVPNTLYWIQLLVELIYPNGTGAYALPDNLTPMIFSHQSAFVPVPDVLINKLTYGPFLKGTIEGDNSTIGINQLSMESGVSTYNSYSFVTAQNSINGTSALVAAQLFNTPNGPANGQLLWIPFLWRL